MIRKGKHPQEIPQIGRFTAQARRDSSSPREVPHEISRHALAPVLRQNLPDPRRGRNTRYSIADIGMAAFSVVLRALSPSFLAHQRMLEKTSGRSNCLTLFGMDSIPSDNHVRNILDPAPPEHFAMSSSTWSGTSRPGERCAACTATASASSVPAPSSGLDGSEYFSSYAISWTELLRMRSPATGEPDRETVEYFHGFLGAAIVTPERNLALPLPPEIIRPQDGNDKQDCERNALKRWLGRIAPRLCRLNPV